MFIFKKDYPELINEFIIYSFINSKKRMGTFIRKFTYKQYCVKFITKRVLRNILLEPITILNYKKN